MKLERITKFIMPPGPVLSLTLLGLMALGGVLYSRAVRAQRFLEPVLAITQPSTTFSDSVSRLLLTEFGGENVKGIRFIGDSIFMESSVIYGGFRKPGESPLLKKIARVILAILRDPQMSSQIDLILISSAVPMSTDPEKMSERRREMQERSELVLNALYDEEPELERDFSTRFSTGSMVSDISEDRANWVEFRFIHSQLLHIEVLKRFQKYIH